VDIAEKTRCPNCLSEFYQYRYRDMSHVCPECKHVYKDQPECAMCGTELTFENIARKENGDIRKDSMGREWCQKCTDEFDDIDWSN
jgi:uncharacterized Zn ribbon protein